MIRTPNRLELTEYEVQKLHSISLKVQSYSIEVGAYIIRYGSDSNLATAAKLYLELLEDLVSDKELSIGAIQYGVFWAWNGTQDQNASQAYRLRCEFLEMLYKNAVAERVEA
jgi:hypothetical protein